MATHRDSSGRATCSRKPDDVFRSLRGWHGPWAMGRPAAHAFQAITLVGYRGPLRSERALSLTGRALRSPARSCLPDGAQMTITAEPCPIRRERHRFAGASIEGLVGSVGRDCSSIWTQKAGAGGQLNLRWSDRSSSTSRGAATAPDSWPARTRRHGRAHPGHHGCGLTRSGGVAKVGGMVTWPSTSATFWRSDP